ncbi:MAG: type II toxin-antitoxin system PemK/MazF family toxin [Campylobacterota bacterium]|nr:type II toxin-antitoxin system PemK/MazF family toxin [Campylobacterota bacterium]
MEHYDKWNEVKKYTQQNKRKLGIKQRDIFWAKIGLNIGNEEYGKGKDFVRPVIIIRQLTGDLFIGIPTTTTKKEDNDYFHTINYIDKTNQNIESSAMILQQKVFSKKRLLSKIGTVNGENFKTIIDKLKKLIDPT